MVGVGATALFLIFAITMEHGDAVTAPDRTEDMTVLSGGEAELCPDPSGHHCSPATCCPAQTQCSQATGSRATDGWECRPINRTNPYLFTTAAYRTCPSTPEPLTLPITLPDGRTVYFQYFSSGNVPVEHAPPDAEVLVVQHGATRVAAQYLCAAEGGAALASPSRKVYMVAPHFLASNDPVLVDKEGHPLLNWNGSDPNGPWRAGYRDMNSTISSFGVIDALLAALPCGEPAHATRQVRLFGHSSGGQLAQRYALLGAQRAGSRCGGGSLGLTTVVANPSSFAYFTRVRADPKTPPGSPIKWVVPTTCPGYNRWEWGLEGGLPAYSTGGCSLTGNLSGCVTRYAQRRLVYLAGLNDTCTAADAASGPNHGPCPDNGLETTCMDLLGGSSRLKRARNFYAYQLDVFEGQADAAFVGVPWSGHDHILMLQSPTSRDILFGPQTL